MSGSRLIWHAAELDGDEVLGLVVELDLPELGISGPAWIVDLEPAPLVPAGPGQVVTATFKHASANVLDLVLTNTPPTNLSSPPSALSSSPTDSIGVTANHPFWSVDRAEFVQAGELQIGERLQTLSGDIHWVQQKLPRPGPEAVYNLEVHDEHVYYVGKEGVLAHNACDSSKVLGRNMAGGHEPLAASLRKLGFAAGHIVPARGFSRRVQSVVDACNDARATLTRVGIDVNDPTNGFRTKSTRHLGSHTDRFLLRLGNALRGKTSKSEVQDILDSIRDDLFSGIY
ncbi:MAG: hypothetical protein JNL67_21165 [Planctomycetaceae bacterium]|nr:hypothetical protein [Planctomycetaceae bacterium]